MKSCRQQFDFIFADPPYALDKIDAIPDLIFGKQLLKEGGIFVLEHGKKNDFTNHPMFIDHRTYGSVNFSIFRAGALNNEETKEADSADESATPIIE